MQKGYLPGPRGKISAVHLDRLSIRRVQGFCCTVRRAAASCFGLEERPDTVWAYNRGVAGTGGLATILVLEFKGLRRDAAFLLQLLLFSWQTSAFWEAVQAVFEQLKAVSFVSDLIEFIQARLPLS